MLSAERNELLTRVEPGTPMGGMLRRYWLPALLSEELPEPDSGPKPIRLLGEDLVAFRDTRGRVGLLRAHCPHRGAALRLGRNEECGLRCLYHGWKMDVFGNVVEMPNEPEGSSLQGKVRHTAHVIREAGGVIWAYAGPPEHEPPFPNFEWTAMAPSHRLLMKVQQRCNWVQAMEGVLDSSHSNHLHADVIAPTAEQSVVGGGSQYQAGRFNRPSADRHPRIVTHDTSYGFRYGALRKPLVDPDKYQYVRTTLFVAPVFVFVPGRRGSGDMQAFVPVDSECTNFFYAHYSFDEPVDESEFRTWVGVQKGKDIDDEYRPVRTSDNDWLQDRTAMKGKLSTTGISGVLNQDFAIQESMGPIYDRTQEHLGAADVAVIHMRELLLASVQRVARGELPVGLDKGPVAYDRLRAADAVIPLDTPWQSVGALPDEQT